MGNPKWNSGVGIARASSATNEPASPAIFPVCQSGQIVSEPMTYARQVAFLADIDHIAPVGFNHTFSIDGIQPDPKVAGYLWWLALGLDTFAMGTHQITPAAASQYLNVFLDLQADIEGGGGDEVLRLIGAKIANVEWSQPTKGIATMKISGPGCTLGTPVADLTPTVPTGADMEPLGWKHLQAAGGWVKIALDGGAFAEDDTVQNFGIKYQRNPIPSGISLGSNQPTQIDNGIRNVSFEFEKEFYGSEAEAQIAAFLAQETIGFEAKYIIDTNAVTLTIPIAHFSGNVLPNVGQEEDVLKLKVTAQAFKGTVNPVLYVYVIDNEVGAYS